MSKAHSYHFIFQDGTEYVDLVPSFPDVLNIILKENDHFQGNESSDEENRDMFVQLNRQDLEENRKPEGYNRKGKIRLVFPTDAKEFYIKTYSKSTDMSKIADNISTMLTAAGIKFEVRQNDRTDFD